MSNIKIFFLSLLEEITGVDEIIISIEKNSTIKDVLNLLTSKFGEDLKITIFENPEALSKYIIISLNGTDIRSLKNLESNIQDGDEVTLLPAIAGG
jgi:molybdopterin synthase sulfur carrier subunit